MLIDATYFKGEILIAGTDRPAVEENIEAFIEKYEPKVLNALLGEDLYSAFKTGLEVDPVAAEWVTLRDDKNLKDIIANYVYFWYMKDNASQTSAIGETISKAENASVVSSLPKLVRAWNEMVEYCFVLNKYLDDNIETYPEWKNTYTWESCTIPDIYKLINAFGI